jgi:hypothetical protein
MRRRTARRIIMVVAVVAIIAVLAIGAVFALQGAREQATLSVRESVLNAAKQCCAIEGSYPTTLEHLEANYGLVINHNDYVVSYEWFADNVLPSVVVTAR